MVQIGRTLTPETAVHSLVHTPLEGGNTSQTQRGPLKLPVKHGKVFWALCTVLSLENNSLTFILKHTLPSAPVLKNVVLSFYCNILFPAKSYHLCSYLFGYLLLTSIVCTLSPQLRARERTAGSRKRSNSAPGHCDEGSLPRRNCKSPAPSSSPQSKLVHIRQSLSLLPNFNKFRHMTSTSERVGELLD